MSRQAPITLLSMFDPGEPFFRDISSLYESRTFDVTQGYAGLPAHDAAQIRVVLTNAAIGVPRDLVDALPALELILSLGIGVNAIDLDHARLRGVAVVNTPTGDGQAVADHAIALLLASNRRICEADRYVRSGRWGQEPVPMSRGLAGRVCGIAGLGRIGRAIATRAEAFGMSIAYLARSPRPDVNWSFHPDIASLAAVSDFLVLAIPAGPHNDRLVNAAVLTQLGPGGILVNVARGSLVDQDALVSALQSGTIESAALDVFEGEPNVPAAFHEISNLILTPHIAGFTHSNMDAVHQNGLAKLHAFAAGGRVDDQLV